ncbi:YkgJ family cysteine cluster protein [Pseudomonas tohonis]|uniref:YkgJ family cysteine cluster protein n=1 Tax=Pseudomonas tohonis TaxID=2725477 RepID=UPI001F3EACC3|nr:YkgJ family cysteine cluster protein [Pseudomonas tohonis]
MKIKDAIKILNQHVSRLERIESSWSNCRSCPHGGACCIGVSNLLIFPEEQKTIKSHLRKNKEILAYAIQRLEKKQGCYFHSSESKTCLIHEVRPLNCRWTPYTAFPEPDGMLSISLRDENCKFEKHAVEIESEKAGIIKIRPINQGEYNHHFLYWPKISGLDELKGDNDKLTTIESLLETLKQEPGIQKALFSAQKP